MSNPYKFDYVCFGKGGSHDVKADAMEHGGKGAGLIRMANAGLNVPPGIIISTTSCAHFETAQAKGAGTEFIDELMANIKDGLTWLSYHTHPTALYSVRSGAPVSMPGMMDTILNVGSIRGDAIFDTALLNRLGCRAAYDCQRRFVEMYATTCFDRPKHEYAECKQLALDKFLVDSEYELDKEGMRYLLEANLAIWFKCFEDDLTHSLETQLTACIRAVFESWNSERAKVYRKLNNIPDHYGTAVVIQEMVFGNLNDDSGTGVLFSRDPMTGAKAMYGEFLVNAQGEDVVAGTSTPQKLIDMAGISAKWDETYYELESISEKLEHMYHDMVDVEFTVQNGELFVLQSRVGKRSARAAFKIAHDLARDKVITRKQAFARLTRDQLVTMRRKTVNEVGFTIAPTYTGIAASPGIVTGKAQFKKKGIDKTNIMIAHDTSPDDIQAMNDAVGILTMTGGATSHAAVVARAMDKPCVCGVTNLDLAAIEGKQITIDGATGRVWVDVDVPVIEPVDIPELATMAQWALEEQGALLHLAGPHVVGAGKVAIGEAVFTPARVSTFVQALRGNAKDKILDVNVDSYLDPSDLPLFTAFGTDYLFHLAENAQQTLNLLITHRAELAGMRIIYFEQDMTELKGFLDIVPKNEAERYLPGDFALFTAIKGS